MVSFMIYTASARNILDTPWYLILVFPLLSASRFSERDRRLLTESPNLRPKPFLGAFEKLREETNTFVISLFLPNVRQRGKTPFPLHGFS
jgi:hypothetical protein